MENMEMWYITFWNMCVFGSVVMANKAYGGRLSDKA